MNDMENVDLSYASKKVLKEMINFVGFSLRFKLDLIRFDLIWFDLIWHKDFVPMVFSINFLLSRRSEKRHTYAVHTKTVQKEFRLNFFFFSSFYPY